MFKLRLGGVPEHFNHPIHMAIHGGMFERSGIDLQWQTYEGGTGEMNAALRDNECDVCILLTEGIITNILQGNPSRIISGYVRSPLIWGVHTGKNSEITYDQAFKHRIAISRMGSGSHLMPIVDALIKGKPLREDQFNIVKNIDGAIASLNGGNSDIFYWEKYTTKPYVEKGLLRRVGEFISPWPCFMIAATEKIIQQAPDVLDKMLRVIHAACEQFMNNADAPSIIARDFNLSLNDATYWFHMTEWATHSWVSNKVLVNVLFTLKEAGIIPSEMTAGEIIWKRD